MSEQYAMQWIKENSKPRSLDVSGSELTDLLCGCGKLIRYSGRDGYGSCNKYGRCPTYEEMREILQMQNSLLTAYRLKRGVDGLNGRTWDASKHFRAEAMIEELEK